MNAYTPQTVAVGDYAICIPEPDDFTKMLVSVGMLTPEDYVQQAPRGIGTVVRIVEANTPDGGGRFILDMVSPQGEHTELTAMLIGDGSAVLDREEAARLGANEEASEFAARVLDGTTRPLFGEIRNPDATDEGLPTAADLDDLVFGDDLDL